MADKKSVFKSCLLGCLGILVFGFLFAGVSALLAWRTMDDQDVTVADTTPVAADEFVERTGAPGRVMLKLGQGQFRVLSAEPGEGLRVETRYDREAYELEDQFEREPDGTWTYALEFQRTMPGLQALFRNLMGADGETYVYIYLPPDVPIALDLYVQEGGFKAEFGGLWLTQAEITFDKGGFDLEVDEPMHEPMAFLKIKGHMGGFDAKDLGNASPRRLDVACRMGGADIGLGGTWAQDCDASISVTMGGVSLHVPDELEIEFQREDETGLMNPSPADAEVSRPRMRLDLQEKFGQIEFVK